MMPHIHAEQSPNAATNDCQSQQCSFRYAPLVLFSLQFVYAIDKEGDDVDNHQII
jgi:hypothetical protein